MTVNRYSYWQVYSRLKERLRVTRECAGSVCNNVTLNTAQTLKTFLCISVISPRTIFVNVASGEGTENQI